MVKDCLEIKAKDTEERIERHLACASVFKKRGNKPLEDYNLFMAELYRSNLNAIYEYLAAKEDAASGRN